MSLIMMLIPLSFQVKLFHWNIKDFANTIDLLENNKSLIFIEDGIDTKSDVGKLMRYVVVVRNGLKNNLPSKEG